MPTSPDLPTHRRPASRWHALDPLTRLVVSVGTLVAAVLLQGVVCLAALGLVAVLLPATVAGVLRQVLVLGFALSLPLAVSVVIVNVLFSPEGTPIVELGPLVVTSEGVQLAASVLTRVLTMAGAVVLFYLTVRPSALVASLQHHGVRARATFVVHNAVAMIPRLIERAGEVAEAQRARGLDTEGRPWRRARGLVAMAAPTVLGTFHEVEARTLALESRGFSRPGRPTLLWTPTDGRLQQLARWAIVAALPLLLVARLSGALPC